MSHYNGCNRDIGLPGCSEANYPRQCNQGSITSKHEYADNDWHLYQRLHYIQENLQACHYISIQNGRCNIQDTKGERPMSYGRWCPQQMRVARSTSTQCQSDYYQHSTLINIAHLPFSNQPSCFVPQPASSMFSSASISSFDILPQIQCPSQDMTILSPQHIPPNTVYHSQLFYAFILNQHQVINSFSTFQMYSTDCCQHGSLSYVKFPSHLLSSTMLHLNIELLALHSSCKQPHSALEKTSCNIATGHIF